MVDQIRPSEVEGINYFMCRDCDNEGFDSDFRSLGKLKCSCGSKAVEGINPVLYKCEVCGFITADKDTANKCCD